MQNSALLRNTITISMWCLLFPLTIVHFECSFKVIVIAIEYKKYFLQFNYLYIHFSLFAIFKPKNALKFVVKLFLWRETWLEFNRKCLKKLSIECETTIFSSSLFISPKNVFDWWFIFCTNRKSSKSLNIFNQIFCFVWKDDMHFNR